MDHHCPWVGNCIGFYNYKFFMSMLFSVTLLVNVVWIQTRSLVNVALLSVDAESEVVFFIVMCFFLAFTLALLVSVFFAFHLYLMMNNYTTIEFCEKRKDKEQFKVSPYNRGFWHNFQSILGYNPLFWFVPIAPDYAGAGLFFELRVELD